LIPFELPAIRDAYLHASRFEIRELVLADCKLGQDPRLRQFAMASRQIGKSQLMRLRPLRDQRIVQRYLKAVEDDEAPGWHTVVLGLILSLYSLPLRQGLVNYGQQTLRGFIYSANRSLGLEEAQCEALHSELCLPLCPSVEALLSDLSVIR
jgi:urease accessory protein UreF